MKPMNRNAIPVNAISPQRPTANAASVSPRITAGHGSHFNPRSMYSSAYVMPSLIPSNSQRPLVVNHFVASSIASPVTSRTDLGKLVDPSLDCTWATVVGNSIPGPQNARHTTSTTMTETTRRPTSKVVVWPPAQTVATLPTARVLTASPGWLAIRARLW